MAKWSTLWKTHNPAARKFALHDARFTPPSPAKKRIGGEYPHLQPFFQHRKPKELLAA